MKLNTFIFLVFAFSYGNVNKTEKDSDSNFNSHIKDSEHYNAIQIDDEYIDWRSIRINGKLPLLTSKDLLFQFAGPADSIVAPGDVCVSFYDKPFEHGYFRGIEVEIYGDSTVITSLNFNKNHDLFVNAPRITLNHKTTLSDLQTLFPSAVKDKRQVDIYRFGMAIAIELRTAKDPTDDAWLLFFSDGNLIRMDYWMPC